MRIVHLAADVGPVAAEGQIDLRTSSRIRRSSIRCSVCSSSPATESQSERPRLAPAPSQPFSSAKR